MNVTKAILTSSLIGFLVPVANAAAFPFPTGVDDNGVVLDPGSVDPHYSIFETGTQAVTMAANPAWIPNSATSSWIWETSNGTPVFVTRTFRLEFDLSGYDLANASISGTWSTDNSGVDVIINGLSTGQTSPGFTSYTPFSIVSNFQDGPNVLDFVVSDFGVISGFRIDSIALNGVSVPEPETYALVTGLGLAGLALCRHGRRD